MIQEGGLFPHLTALDNITLISKILKWSKDKIHSRIQQLTEMTHFPTQALKRYPTQLSGGQRQRVGLMRALMLNPEFLLLDEPLGALDPIIRRDLQQELREIFTKLKKTVVIVTHDLGEAGFLGDTIALLRSGQVIQHGTLSDLVYKPHSEFVTEFISAQRSPLESLKP
jgi:osmoprotectant transport system ATP-binding protein